MNIPSTVALPIHAASGPVANLVASMSGISEPSTIRSMTSKKYPAAISAMTLICSGEILALSSDVPTKPSIV